jgi:hypothetical protein
MEWTQSKKKQNKLIIAKNKEKMLRKNISSCAHYVTKWYYLAFFPDRYPYHKSEGEINRTEITEMVQESRKSNRVTDKGKVLGSLQDLKIWNLG